MKMLKTAVVILGLLTLAGLGAGGWLAVNILRQQGRLLLRVEKIEKRLGVQAGAEQVAPTPARIQGLPVGTLSPTFSLRQVFGDTMIELKHLLEGKKPVVLFFSDPNCGPCNELMPQIAAWQQGFGDNMTIAVVSRGDRASNAEKAKTSGVQNVLLQDHFEVAEQFMVYGTPGAVWIGADGKIAADIASGSTEIERLVHQASGRPLSALPETPRPAASTLQPVTIPLGSPAPEFSLPSITGKTVALAELIGKKTLLLFWNPGCHFCAQMLGRLQDWERRRDGAAPDLVLVSAGSVQANRDMGLTSEVLLDQSFSTGIRYGVGGTPSAVLIDQQGKIVSEIAVGANAVMALAGEETQLVAA